MLKSGEIDALYSALVPPSLLKRSPNVRRLFKDPGAVERLFRKTGIFPIMHIVAIRKEVSRRNPWIAQSLYQALKEAKAKAEELYRFQEANMHRLFMVPWLTEHREENRKLMGDDLGLMGWRATAMRSTRSCATTTSRGCGTALHARRDIPAGNARRLICSK